MKKVLIEALVVAAAGAAFAFGANALSPLGLKLTSNYFPGDNHRPKAPMTAAAGKQTSDATPSAQAGDPVAAHLRERGLQVTKGSEASTLFRDPRTEQGLIIFIDARDDHHYQEGHIPGAYQFDHYHPEKHLAEVLPACQAAQQIIVYCNGGECEDSEFAAIKLRDEIGIPKERLFVYTGGIKEWEQMRLPVETGSRKSGKLR